MEGSGVVLESRGTVAILPLGRVVLSQPTPRYQQLKDHVAFYPGRVDACYLDDERVEAQEGDFYGGWITADIVGPFTGGPGTAGW